MGMAEHFISSFAQEAARYNRIYISNVHENLSDTEIKQMFEAFGRVISCSLVRDVTEPEVHMVRFLITEIINKMEVFLSWKFFL